jgi:predicted permease
VHVFLGLGLIMLLGSSLHRLLPELDVDRFRQSINTLVLYVLLPALIFETFCDAPLNRDLVMVPLALSAGIFGCLAVATMIYRFIPLESKTKGALILAASFGNVTYLGIPILQGLFPDSVAAVSEVAILCEITKSPINLSLGSAIAIYYGSGGSPDWGKTLRQILLLPPLWAAGIALAVNLSGATVPLFVIEACEVLGRTVSGLMILSLGMALKPTKLERPLALVPALALKLAFFPGLVYLVAMGLKMQAPFWQAVTIEGAMAPQLLTFVIADRFGLDVRTLAVVVFLGTVLSFFTIPLVAGMVGV